MQRLLTLLALIVPFVLGCGQMVTYRTSSSRPTRTQYEIERRFQLDHVVLSNDGVSKEVHELPEAIFDDVQGAGLNCWRFETADGRKFTAKDWAIDIYVEDTVILRGTGPSRFKEQEQEVRNLEITRIVSLWPIPLRKGEDIIVAQSFSKEQSKLNIVDVYGAQHLVAPAETHLAELRTKFHYPAYGFDMDGEATRITNPTIKEFLQKGMTIANAERYRSVRLSEIKRWEFEKEWPPTALLVLFGIQVPVGIAALGSPPGSPSRCPSD
jgi:hypothetical protein